MHDHRAPCWLRRSSVPSWLQLSAAMRLCCHPSCLTMSHHTTYAVSCQLARLTHARHRPIQPAPTRLATARTAGGMPPPGAGGSPGAGGGFQGGYQFDPGMAEDIFAQFFGGGAGGRGGGTFTSFGTGAGPRMRMFRGGGPSGAGPAGGACRLHCG
jgi:hypothetical protein